MTSLTSQTTLFLAYAPIVLPLGLMLLLLSLNFVGVKCSETSIARSVASVMIMALVCAVSLVFVSGTFNAPRLPHLIIDPLASTFLLLATFLANIVGHFSNRYLHRDPGYNRFFCCFLAFVGGINLLAEAGTLSALIAGWELVGLSSVLLIGYYNQRLGPMRGATAAFVSYRIADIGLLGAAALVPYWLHSDHLPLWLTSNETSPTSVAVLITALGGLLLLLAAAGKSAQLPLGGWLPKAMEGPTPSSAIFYGALSIHAGAYLLLRTQPWWNGSLVTHVSIVVVGFLTTMHSVFVGRTRVDAKTSLGYAAIAQVGLIFVEIGFGLPQLALWHIVGHSILRTLQLLTAPSTLSNWLRFHDHNAPRVTAVEGILPERLQMWLYRQSLASGNLDTLARWLFVSPILRLARFIQRTEANYSAEMNGQVHADLLVTGPSDFQSMLQSNEVKNS